MKLGIFTPYRRCETTLAALRLADLGLTIPYSVEILVSGQPERGIHPYWDRRVVTAKRQNVYRWATNCSHVIWFEPHDKHLEKANVVVRDSTRHWLVVGWHRLQRDHRLRLRKYHRLICPSKQIYDGVVSHVLEGVGVGAGWCLWDSGLNPVQRLPQRHVQGRTRLYVPFDGDSMDTCGLLVLRVLYELLETLPYLEVTMDCGKSWPRNVRPLIAEMQKLYGQRFRVETRTSVIWQTTYFHENDWTWLPTMRSDFGQMAWRSLSCGTPVICYDIPPFSEFVRGGSTGILLPCDLIFNWLSAAGAVPTGTSLVKELKQVLQDEELLIRLRSKNWKLGGHQEAFIDFWKREWKEYDLEKAG